MKEPILVVMAAGMGSRYGGLKQIDPIGVNGEIIMDYSLFDAYKAGFRRVIFIIKEELYEDFRNKVGINAEKYFSVNYAFQKLSDIPAEFTVPEGRVKPWGTGHAVYSAREFLDAPFAAINSDDYYGTEAFKKIYDFLSSSADDEKKHYVMIGYKLMNTLSENGHVARGVCSTDENSMLIGITERTRIEPKDGAAAFSEDDGATWAMLSEDTIVSMNMWGFTESFVRKLIDDFPAFLSKAMQENPLKGEYLLPFVVNDMLKSGEADVKVLTSSDKWYGVTYKEDKPVVIAAMKNMVENGTYLSPLWQL